MQNVTVTSSTQDWNGEWVVRVDGIVRLSTPDLFVAMRCATKWGYHA